MNLTVEDWILWVGGFIGVVTLLGVLLWRGGARVFPWLAASCGFQAVQTMTLYVIHLKGGFWTYFWTYWYGQIPEQLLQVSVIGNLAYVLFQSHGDWRRRSKDALAVCGVIALVIAVAMTWISDPQVSQPMAKVCIQTKLFTSILTTELAAAVIATALIMECSWTRWAKGLALGMLIQFPINFAIEIAHTYFGDGRFYQELVHIEGYAEAATLCCWLITFWRKQPVMETNYNFGKVQFGTFR